MLLLAFLATGALEINNSSVDKRTNTITQIAFGGCSRLSKHCDVRSFVKEGVSQGGSRFMLLIKSQLIAET